MSEYASIQKVAALSFAEHVLTNASGRSWRMGKPGHGAYAFRVTWGPGVLTISGDVGRAVYEVWPGLATIWDAVEFVERADFDYLCEKSGFTKEFDRDATVSHLIEMAYADLRCGSPPAFFRRVCEEYGGCADIPCDRKEAARAFRDDQDLTAERVYNITSDFEAPSYSYSSCARWTFEAAKLWARTMRASEPRWHRLWRELQRETNATKRAWRSTKHFRPELYAAPRGFGHDTLWVRRTYIRDGRDLARMASVAPLRLFGLRLSWAGLWRETGSSWPLGRDSRDAQFKPVRDGGLAA